MVEWTPEAREYLDGYLGQVSALARHQGDDAAEIVTELREHIERETEASSGPLVTVEQLRVVLAGIGTPDQIAGVESALEGPGVSTESLRNNVQRLRDEGERDAPSEFPPMPPPGPVPNLTVPSVAPAPEPARSSRGGCWIAALVLGAIALGVLAVLVIMLALTGLSYRRDVKAKNDSQNDPAYVAMQQHAVVAREDDGQTAQTMKAWDRVFASQMERPAISPAEATALEVMGAIAALQMVFQKFTDEEGNSDYGTWEQLASVGGDEGSQSQVDLLRARAKAHGYRLTMEVTQSGPGQRPGFQCIGEPIESGPTAYRKYFVDASLMVRYTDDGSTPSALSAAVPQNETVWRKEWTP